MVVVGVRSLRKDEGDRPMTRAEIADKLEKVSVMGPRLGKRSVMDRANDIKAIEAAAALLRQTCKGCQYWRVDEDNGDRWCYGQIPDMGVPVPADGSGFCHAWKAKES